MKMPESVNLGQQSIATVDPSKPTQLANAQGREADAMSTAFNKFGEIGETIYKRDASGERNSKKAQYHMEEAKLRADLEAEPYERMDDGTLRSRAPDLIDAYEKGEAELRNNILGNTENSMAQQQLGADFESANSVTHTAVQATAAKWANDAAFAKNETAFQDNLDNYQYEEARRVTSEMLMTGQINEQQAINKMDELDAHQTYYGVSLEIRNGGTVGADDANARLDRISAIESANSLPAKQVAALRQQAFQARTEVFLEELDSVIWDQAGVGRNDPRYIGGIGWDEGGFEMGDWLQREILNSTPEELGVRDNDEKLKLHGQVESALNRYKVKLNENKEAMYADTACNRALNGAPMTRRNIAGVSDTAKAQGLGQDVKAVNCAFSKSTVGMEPWSDEWVKNGVEREISDYGFLSGEAQSHFLGLITNATSSPVAAQRFIYGAHKIQELKKLPGGVQAFDFFKAEEMALVDKVVAITNASDVMTPDALNTLTASVKDITPEHQAARISNYNTNTKPNLKEMLEDELDPGMFSGAVIPDEFSADVDTVMQALVPIYNNDEQAFKRAVELTKGRWRATTFDTTGGWMPNDVQFMKDSPMTVWANQVSAPEKLHEALQRDYDEMMFQNGLDPNEFTITKGAPDGKGGTQFFIRKRGEAVNMPYRGEDGQVVSWNFNYKESSAYELEVLESAAKEAEARAVAANEQIDLASDQRSPGRARIERSIPSGIETAVNVISDTAGDIAAPFSKLFTSASKGDERIKQSVSARDKRQSREVETVNDWNAYAKSQKLAQEDPEEYARQLERARGASLEHRYKKQVKEIESRRGK